MVRFEIREAEDFGRFKYSNIVLFAVFDNDKNRRFLQSPLKRNKL